MINKDRLIATFLDLVHINSPSKSERPIADYVCPVLKDIGFSIVEDDAGAKIGGSCGNLIATMEGTASSGARLFFNAHMDTVEPTDGIRVIVENNVIKTDGNTVLGADCKSGVALILESARTAVEQGIPFKSLQIVFSVAEEIGLLGARNMDTSLLSADVGYVFDTERPAGQIITAAPTHENLMVKIYGRASHAGIRPEDGVSAIVAASRAIASMKLGRIDEETTANVGVIRGGRARNIVPDEVEIYAEARSRDEMKLQAQVRHMVETFESSAFDIGAKAEINVEREYRSYRWMPEDPPVRLAKKAAELIGINPILAEAGGGSDANIFNHAGIPAVVIGVGYEYPHSRGERLLIDEFVNTAEFAVALLRCSVAA